MRYKLLQIYATEKTVLLETDNAKDVAQAYINACACGQFVRIEKDGIMLRIFEADNFCSKTLKQKINIKGFNNATKL